jgi:hypothetical protein
VSSAGIVPDEKRAELTVPPDYVGAAGQQQQQQQQQHLSSPLIGNTTRSHPSAFSAVVPDHQGGSSRLVDGPPSPRWVLRDCCRLPDGWPMPDTPLKEADWVHMWPAACGRADVPHLSCQHHAAFQLLLQVHHIDAV